MISPAHLHKARQEILRAVIEWWKYDTKSQADSEKAAKALSDRIDEILAELVE